tara:strand:- start:7455 stop:8618 length:1164 start_codon:yes stop_codon:yes gene_type:complete
MDLYGAGVSISQANGLSREARTLAHQSRDFNGQLAANIDEVRNQKDQEGLEQQAINMYKGGTAAHSFASTKEGEKIISGLKGGMSKGGQFLPVSFREKFAKEIGDSASSNPLQATARGDEAVNFNIRQSMRSGARSVGGAGAEVLEDVPLGAAGAAESSGFVGSRVSGLIEDLPGGLAELGAETAEETLSAANPLSEGLAASRPTQAASSAAGAGEALVETSTQAERTGEFANVAARSGVAEEAVQGGIRTGETAAAEALAKTEGKAILKKAGTKLGLAGVGGGLEIYKDIQRGGIGNNWKQEVGNIGNIVGSGLEIAGVLGFAIPGVGLGLEALGAGISLGSTALETAGDIQDGAESKAKQTSQLSNEGKGIGGAQQITTAVARTQ